MATPPTMNTWLDMLSSSILTQMTAPKQNRNKLQDAFRRCAKRNIYGRTNQFEVAKRLDGLEEKFLILAQDHLSETLHRLRIELNDHSHQWLPDVLDLLLQLSGDLTQNNQLLELYRIPPRLHTPPPLKWKDVLADDPIDLKDPLWKIPNFKDHSDSDYDDEDKQSNAQDSPRYARKKTRDHSDLEITYVNDIIEKITHEDDVVAITARFMSTTDTLPRVTTEHQLAQEIVFTLKGLPSLLLMAKSRSYALNPNLSVSSVPPAFLQSIAERVISLRHPLDRLRTWLAEKSDRMYIQAMKNAAENILNRFDAKVNEILDRWNNPNVITAVSIPDLLDTIEILSLEVLSLEPFLLTVEPTDPIRCLETLYACTNESQFFEQSCSYQTLISLLLPALKAYLHPLWNWVEAGTVHEENQFFIKVCETTSWDEVWKGRFAVSLSSSRRPTYFLRDVLEPIMICGKTAAFLKALPSEIQQVNLPNSGACSFDLCFDGFQEDTLIPFDAAFKCLLREHISRWLQEHTVSLKSILTNDCGLTETLVAITYIYLAQDSPALNDVERIIFDKIDKCVNGWNDRFLITEMLEEAFEAHDAKSVLNAITVHSAYTSSRTMQNRRRSVKILSGLTLNFQLSWPVANIITSASIVSYQHISLMLTQIRRATHCLQNTGYVHASTTPLDEDTTSVDQKFAQLLAFKLLVFLKIVYTHMATTIIIPATKTMHNEMTCASTVDLMIEVHRQYIKRIEFACLVSPKLNVTKEILITILDMCVRFSDLVSNSSSRALGVFDHEERSFKSARSRHRNIQEMSHGDYSDDDEDPDIDDAEGGYSTFIVLEDDTTIIKELRKLQIHFTNQLRLFTAGIKGVSKGSQYIGDLEGLADQLSWNLLR